MAEPQEYRRLASSPEACALVYREPFKQPLAAYDIEAIRTHLNKDCALDSSKFQDEIEAILGRRAIVHSRDVQRNQKMVMKSIEG